MLGRIFLVLMAVVVGKVFDLEKNLLCPRKKMAWKNSWSIYKMTKTRVGVTCTCPRLFYYSGVVTNGQKSISIHNSHSLPTTTSLSPSKTIVVEICVLILLGLHCISCWSLLCHKIILLTLFFFNSCQHYSFFISHSAHVHVRVLFHVLLDDQWNKNRIVIMSGLIWSLVLFLLCNFYTVIYLKK